MNQAVSAGRPVVQNPKTGRMTATGQLSEMQQSFVMHMVAGNAAPEAARLAGYTDPYSAAYYQQRQPAIMQAVRDGRTRLIDGDLANTALATMRELMTDRENTPASVRFQAAKWTLETAGHKAADGAGLGLPDPNKNLADMTLEELARFIQAGEQALQVIRSEPIDVTPEPTVSAFSAQGSTQHGAPDPLEVADLLG